MFVLVLVLLAAAVLVRLAVVVRDDRPTDPPRSHVHELDLRSPQFRIV